MPEHEPVASHEQAAAEQHPATPTAVQSPAPTPPPAAYTATGYARGDGQDEWLEEPEELLPRRPRRRLIGAGGNPLVLALLGVLLVACGFIGGVLIEKGESSSSSSTGSATAGLASRFRALRGAAGAGTSSSTTSSAAASAAGGFTRPTAGTVAYLAGKTLYVTNSEGNTVKVTTAAGTSVTKTVKSSVKSIHPGETVTVTGETGSGGSVSAESISVGSSGSGLAALFGAGGAGAAGSSGSSSKASTPSLFGSG